MPLLLLFIITPLIEMIVLIKVGGAIGALPTILLVCLTAAVGLALIRAQGFETLKRFQTRAAKGELPGQEIIDGLCLAIGGAMLLTPGFVTDSFGFLLLIPVLRRVLLGFFLSKMTMPASGQSGFSFHTYGMGAGQRADQNEPQPKPQNATKPSNNILDGEYSRDD